MFRKMHMKILKISLEIYYSTENAYNFVKVIYDGGTPRLKTSMELSSNKQALSKKTMSIKTTNRCREKNIVLKVLDLYLHRLVFV